MTETYGQTIRRLRAAARVSQKDLAERAVMTQPNLCESEKDNRPMTEAEYHKARAALAELIAERDKDFAEAKAGVTG